MKERLNILEWSQNKDNRILLVKRLIDLIYADIETIRLHRISTAIVQTYICCYINSDLEFFFNHGINLNYRINGLTTKGYWLGDIIPELVKYKQRDNSSVWFPLGDHILVRLEYRLDALNKCLNDLHLNN